MNTKNTKIRINTKTRISKIKLVLHKCYNDHPETRDVITQVLDNLTEVEILMYANRNISYTEVIPAIRIIQAYGMFV